MTKENQEPHKEHKNISQRLEEGREESPKRFLEILAKTTGMKLSGDIEPGEELEIPETASEGGVIGIVVIGSCAKPNSRPKDLNVLIALSWYPNCHSFRFEKELEKAFNDNYEKELKNVGIRKKDIEKRRFDWMGFMDGSASTAIPVQAKMLREAEAPLVFSYSRYLANQIKNNIGIIVEFAPDYQK